MKVQFRPTLVVEGTPIKEGGAIDLSLLRKTLVDLSSGMTLNAVAKRSGFNYRNLVQLLTRVETLLNMKLVERVKGHGTVLTNSGDKLLNFLNESEAGLSDHALQYQESLFKIVNSFGGSPTFSSQWTFYSSSDPIIQDVVSQIGAYDLKIAGSGESLERLLAGDADIAGYHVSRESDSRAIHHRLKKSGFEIFPVMKRMQGFMTKKGNPLGIKDIYDLTRPKVRFINRQIGSGTRLLLDTILIEEGIDPNSINGYLHEEYTHSAVANAILANKADVGLGVKNVAIKEKLGFIPVKDEIFFLAMKSDLVKDVRVTRLVRKIRKMSSETSGYTSVGLNRQIIEWVS